MLGSQPQRDRTISRRIYKMRSCGRWRPSYWNSGQRVSQVGGQELASRVVPFASGDVIYPSRTSQRLESGFYSKAGLLFPPQSSRSRSGSYP